MRVKVKFFNEAWGFRYPEIYGEYELKEGEPSTFWEMGPPPKRGGEPYKFGLQVTLLPEETDA